MGLHHILDEPARAVAAKPAVIDGGSGVTVSYGALARESDRLRDRLRAIGVMPGDRVGFYLKKSVDSVTAIFGILKAGAAYVPVDPTAPPSRNAYIHDNCKVKVTVVDRAYLQSYVEEIVKLGPVPQTIVVETTPTGTGLPAALDRLDAEALAPYIVSAEPAPDDPAYILYTSGSTGRPKGVVLSHHNAESFVNWCTDTFRPCVDDVFSSHAPFHFDLSIFDLYVSLKHGATLVLVPEATGKEPLALSQLISERRITVWYSAPSTLSLLAQFGKIPQHDYSSLRMVLFAGEVFPIVHLRSFKQQVPGPRFFNLYGPTETNVCSFYEIPASIPDDRIDPYPIGKVCSNLTGLVIDANGKTVAQGAEGELCIAGPNVMAGYWNLAELTANAFFTDTSGGRWYKTGDLVVEDAEGNFRYVGRRDRMVKRRGYRVELGEIEACLYRHDEISEAAVVALTDDASGIRIKAHLSVRNGRKPSIIELKTFCSKNLPLYMVPDQFAFCDVLPKTSTDKVDYVKLKSLG